MLEYVFFFHRPLVNVQLFIPAGEDKYKDKINVVDYIRIIQWFILKSLFTYSSKLTVPLYWFWYWTFAGLGSLLPDSGSTKNMWQLWRRGYERRSGYSLWRQQRQVTGGHQGNVLYFDVCCGCSFVSNFSIGSIWEIKVYLPAMQCYFPCSMTVLGVTRDFFFFFCQTSSGYFVHHFAPSQLARIPKNVVFVIDKSGSMSGKKMEQVQALEFCKMFYFELKLFQHCYFINVWI